MSNHHNRNNGNNNPHNNGGNQHRPHNGGQNHKVVDFNHHKGNTVAGEVARDLTSAAIERTESERKLAEENAKLREQLAQHDAAQAAGLGSDEAKLKYHESKEATKRSADTKQTCVAIVLLGAIAFAVSKVWGR